MIKFRFPFSRKSAEIEEVKQNEIKVEPAPSLKSGEEYELAFHEKLLDSQKDATDFINKYLIFCYGIVGVSFLYVAGNISKVDLGGAEIDLSKGYVLEYAAGLSCLAYILVFFHMLRLSRILTEIRKSSARISAINVNAKVINLENMHLIVSGLCGVILASARQQTKLALSDLRSLQFGQTLSNVTKFLSTRTNNSLAKLFGSYAILIVRSPGKLQSIIMRILLVLLFVDSPILLIVYLLYWSKYLSVFDHMPHDVRGWLLYCASKIDPIDFLVALSSFGISIASIYSTFILAVSYARDLVQEFLDEIHMSLEEFESGLSSSNPEIAIEARAMLSRFLNVRD